MTIYDFLVRLGGGHRSLPVIGWQQFNNALDYRPLNYNSQIIWEEFFSVTTGIDALGRTYVPDLVRHLEESIRLPNDVIYYIANFLVDTEIPVGTFRISLLPPSSRTWIRDQLSVSSDISRRITDVALTVTDGNIIEAENFQLNNIAKNIKVLSLGTIGAKIALDCAHCWYEPNAANFGGLGVDISLALSISLKGFSKFSVAAGLGAFSFQLYTGDYEGALTGLALNIAAASAYAIGGLYLAIPLTALIVGVEAYNLYQSWGELQNITNIRKTIEQGNVEAIKTIIQQPNFMEHGKYLPEEYLYRLYSADPIWFNEQIKHYVNNICVDGHFQTALQLSEIAHKHGENSVFFSLVVDSFNSGCFIAQQFAFKVIHFLSSEERAKLNAFVSIENIKSYIEQSHLGCNVAINIFKEALFKDEHLEWITTQINNDHSCRTYFLNTAKEVLDPSSNVFLVIKEACAKKSIEGYAEVLPNARSLDSQYSLDFLVNDMERVLYNNADVLVKPKNCNWLNSFNKGTSEGFKEYAIKKFHDAGIDCAGNTEKVAPHLSSLF